MFKSGLNSLKKGASSVANKASSVAKDTSQKAEKMGITTENAKKAGLKGGALAKKVVVGAVNSLITPELIAFCKDPTPEKLQANPQIVLTALAILTALGNPQTAAGRTDINHEKFNIILFLRTIPPLFSVRREIF